VIIIIISKRMKGSEQKRERSKLAFKARLWIGLGLAAS